MIARLHLIVPFALAVPEGAPFKCYAFEDEGYKITFFPPVRTDQPTSGTQPEGVTIGGIPSFLANGLVVEFRKDQFDRRSTNAPDSANPTVDPPAPLVLRVVNFFLERLRYVVRGFMIQQIDSLLSCQWRIQYLNDDGSELQDEEGFVRARGVLKFSFSQVTIHPETWDDLFSLSEFDIPVWDNLRLDALGAFPSVGTAVVLASTSLETFIARVLDELAQRSSVSPTLWRWINKRATFLADPSTEEQFDQLLKEFIGHSLKEDLSLWTAFQHLRKARNTFVHEGIATIGGQPVDEKMARQLVQQVDEIIAWVRQRLPPNLQWPVFDYGHIKSEIKHTILKPSSAGDGAEIAGGAGEATP